jgi:hypothetical protein
MVAKLVGNKLPQELHGDREESEFRDLLEPWFEISAEQTLTSGTRVLFALDPRPS